MPIASAPEDKTAIAASLFFAFLFSSLKINSEAMIAAINANHVGEIPKTSANATAPKDACDSPSLSIDLFLSTSGTPIKAEAIASAKPATNARRIKSYDNISVIVLSMVNPFDVFFDRAKEWQFARKRQNFVTNQVAVVEIVRHHDYRDAALVYLI